MCTICTANVVHRYDYIVTNVAKLPTLQDRRDVVCRYYVNRVKNVNHKLHRLLPARRTVHHGIGAANTYPIPDVITERYKRSLVGSIYNWQYYTYIEPLILYAMHTVLWCSVWMLCVVALLLCATVSLFLSCIVPNRTTLVCNKRVSNLFYVNTAIHWSNRS